MIHLWNLLVTTFKVFDVHSRLVHQHIYNFYQLIMIFVFNSGDVSQDLSMQENYDDEGKPQNKQMSQTSAFEYSSNSDTNTSIELFTSPEASMINLDSNCSGSSGFCDSDLLSPPAENDKIFRRKSISYEILFTNSKENNGQIKVHIIPNQSKLKDDIGNQVESSNVGQSKKLDLKGKETLQQEHIQLRQRVQELERKLHCLEIESERIVGELSRIIERKNETIVKLELELAGVKMES